VIQHGQVFKLKTKGAEGQRLWAYRYRCEGRGSARPQTGGFASCAEVVEKVADLAEERDEIDKGRRLVQAGRTDGEARRARGTV
jgi:hypothetical protein